MNNPIVFVDYHHDSLLQSLILLFEKRLGGKVFRPIGMTWFEKGYWKINDQMDTAQQFLQVGSIPSDGTPPLNANADQLSRTLTHEQFLNTDIDIVIASIPQHVQPFSELAKMKNAIFCMQIGNAWNVPDNGIVKNVMTSAVVDIPPGINSVTYHQEFDTEIFHPGEVILGQLSSEKEPSLYPRKNVYSFINILQNHPDFRTFLECEALLPDYSFKSFGGQCRDGNMNGALELADKMREARFIWHTKSGGDGYGHILHNAFSVGRPVIIRREDYRGKLGDSLLVDGFTAIFIDGLTPQQIVDKIQYYSDPERYNDMVINVLTTFRAIVDFDREEEDIRAFLERCITT